MKSPAALVLYLTAALALLSGQTPLPGHVFIPPAAHNASARSERLVVKAAEAMVEDVSKVVQAPHSDVCDAEERSEHRQVQYDKAPLLEVLIAILQAVEVVKVASKVEIKLTHREKCDVEPRCERKHAQYEKGTLFELLFNILT
jgi:hypothetical protein